jgi:hypothetical protein
LDRGDGDGAGMGGRPGDAVAIIDITERRLSSMRSRRRA